jgi:hypothetical protein
MKKNIFWIALLIITCLGFFLRFWNYSERFGLAYDQAHDAIVARSALSQGKIPLVGPFSSAGPFQTSGTWYWLIMLPTALYKDSVLSPWVFLTGLYVMVIVGMGVLGRKIEGNAFGIILALLTAVSTAQIAQSVNLTNQTPQPVFAFLTIVCAIWYIRRKTFISAFGMGFFSGFSASIHLQGMALGIPVALAFLLGGKTNIRLFLIAVFGAILPMLPIFIWDASNDFVNTQNMIYYYRFDQFNISLDVLGRRWLTYLTQFWPKEWAHIIGGFPYIAISIALLSICFVLYQSARGKIKKVWLYLFLSFGCMTILVRYTRVPLYASFIAFTHPFVILISGWVIYQLYRYKRSIGVIACMLVVVCTMLKTNNEVFTTKINESVLLTKAIRAQLMSMYPGEKFDLYDYKYDDINKSVLTALYLDEKNLISDSGRRIGFTRSTLPYLFETPMISSASGFILDLDATTSSFLVEEKWIRVNPTFIYKSTEEWRH